MISLSHLLDSRLRLALPDSGGIKGIQLRLAKEQYVGTALEQVWKSRSILLATVCYVACGPLQGEGLGGTVCHRWTCTYLHMPADPCRG